MISGAVQNLVKKGNQHGDAFQRETLGAEIARLNHLLEEIGLDQAFENLALVRRRRRLLHALLDPFPPGCVGKMHELDPDASAVIALGFLGSLAIEVQFRNRRRQQVLPQRVEFCLQIAPAAKGIEDLIALRNQQVAGVTFQGKIFGDHSRMSTASL